MTGTVAPQPILVDGGRLDDRIGYRYAALLKPCFRDQAPQGLIESLRQKDVEIFADECPALESWFAQSGVEGVIVRPDRYVLGAARTQADMESLVAAI